MNDSTGTKAQSLDAKVTALVDAGLLTLEEVPPMWVARQAWLLQHARKQRATRKFARDLHAIAVRAAKDKCLVQVEVDAINAVLRNVGARLELEEHFLAQSRK